jgi:iron-sulfur cluster repair protein YtfE (RIC family)
MKELVELREEANMRAIELLKQDHDEAMRMIEQLERVEQGAQLRGSNLALFGRLKSALTLHTLVEEQILYHSLANLEETKELIKGSYDGHRTVDELLVKMSAPSQEWRAALSELKTALQHHVREEEGALFPKAERLLGGQRLQEMGRQITNIKRGKAATA